MALRNNANSEAIFRCKLYMSINYLLSKTHLDIGMFPATSAVVLGRKRCQFIGDTVINSLFNPGFVQQNRDVPVRVRPGTAGIAVIVRTT